MDLKEKQLKIKEELTYFTTYDKGLELRKQLNKIAKKLYIPKHTPAKYLDFMGQYDIRFSKLHTQDSNHPYYLEMFSVISQHVYGDCVAECLDKAMKIEKQYKKSLKKNK
jgi:hypothetical protein